MVRVKTKITDRDSGYRKMVGQLGEMGNITIGVQGKEAQATHPDGELSVGEVAAIHELGLGVPKRSWLISWFDENEKRNLSQMNQQLQLVLKGQKTRNKALIDVGYAWTKEVRDRIADGKITPPLAAATVEKKGHATPLWDTGTLANSITYKIFLPMFKSIRNATQRAAARRK